MKIGLIVYSHTGNTYSVMEKLYNLFIKQNREVSLEKIEVTRDIHNPNKPIQFNYIPAIDKFDIIVFASLVEAFSVSIVMKQYLENIKSLRGKKVACFVTQYLPYPWMGGKRAIKQIKQICEAKGGEVVDTGIINWKNKYREKMIEELIQRFSNCFKE